MTSLDAEKLYEDWVDYPVWDGQSLDQSFAAWLRENLVRINAACGGEKMLCTFGTNMWMQIKDIYRRHHKGGCGMLSHGYRCDCFLCQVEKEIIYPLHEKAEDAPAPAPEREPCEEWDEHEYKLPPLPKLPAPEREPPKSLHHPKCQVSQVVDGDPCDPCICDRLKGSEAEPSESLRDVVTSLLWNWDIRSDYWEKRLRAAVAADDKEREQFRESWKLMGEDLEAMKWKARADKAEQENAELGSQVDEKDSAIDRLVQDLKELREECDETFEGLSDAEQKCKRLEQENAELKDTVGKRDSYINNQEGMIQGLRSRAEKAVRENAELRERYEDRLRNQKGIVENHVENERRLCQENAELRECLAAIMRNPSCIATCEEAYELLERGGGGA